MILNINRKPLLVCTTTKGIEIHFQIEIQSRKALNSKSKGVFMKAGFATTLKS